MANLILSLIGPDRPGLVSGLAEQVAAHGGSWLESRMSHLAGQFAGIALVTLPDAEVEKLTAELAAGDLQVSVHHADATPITATGPALTLDLVCQDRPGIVRDISAVLTAEGANIEELTTNIEAGSFSGETMFRAEIRLRLPEGHTTDTLREALERLGNDLMVDLTLRE
jgi:glycine cleavage system regulatory protein